MTKKKWGFDSNRKAQQGDWGLKDISKNYLLSNATFTTTVPLCAIFTN